MNALRRMGRIEHGRAGVSAPAYAGNSTVGQTMTTTGALCRVLSAAGGRVRRGVGPVGEPLMM